MKALNAGRIERGSFELGFGVALHVGDVMYGNIGTTTRLDFTVIGPAVNVTSRMQTLTKELRRQVLLSAPFALMCGCSAEFLTTLGRFPLARRRRRRSRCSASARSDDAAPGGPSGRKLKDLDAQLVFTLRPAGRSMP